jgi:hypothetical protein
LFCLGNPSLLLESTCSCKLKEFRLMARLSLFRSSWCGMKRLRRRPLTVQEILRWADAHREMTGKWPTRASGQILGAKLENWLSVDYALRQGLRDLPGNSSLAQLLSEHRGARNIHQLPALTEEQILQWADDHHQRTGGWPTRKSGTIPNSGGEKWQAIDTALHLGARKLKGGSSLARLLARHRGVRNRKQLPPLTEERILAWADDHHEHTGSWPKRDSGPILDSPGETWTAINVALNHGIRHLPGGSSLALLLAERRGVPHAAQRPGLSPEQILSWADAHHERTGRWPNGESGDIAGADGETWLAVDQALRRGLRELPGGSSLAKLLAAERGIRSRGTLPQLSRKIILAWADAHYERTQKWPNVGTGPIPEAPQETWQGVNSALRNGSRGLRGHSSLVRLLARYRGKRNHLSRPPLSEKSILAWADAHLERTGKWPNVNSGPIVDAPGETWRLIDNALRQGNRQLDGGSSLLQLLVKRRGVRNPLRPPHLTEELILYWAELHYQRTGTWPKYDSGLIWRGRGETWAQVDYALRHGKRKLPGGSSLAKFLASQGCGTGGQRGRGKPSPARQA